MIELHNYNEKCDRHKQMWEGTWSVLGKYAIQMLVGTDVRECTR